MQPKSVHKSSTSEISYENITELTQHRSSDNSESAEVTQIDDGLVGRHHDSRVGNVLDELRRQTTVHAANTLVPRHLHQRLPETVISTAFLAHPRTSHLYSIKASAAAK